MNTSTINLRALISWLARIVAALIMVQSLFFKFSAAPESVYIFTTVGMEPWGRILIGCAELVAAVLLILPATAWLGAILSLGIMAGAIMMHLTLLGIEVQGDGGYLFILAVIVAGCAAVVIVLEKKKWLRYLPMRKVAGVI